MIKDIKNIPCHVWHKVQHLSLYFKSRRNYDQPLELRKVIKIEEYGRATQRRFVPCLAPLGHLTADKRLRYASPKLPSTTSFIRNTLGDIAERFKKMLDIFGIRLQFIVKGGIKMGEIVDKIRVTIKDKS